MRLLKFASKQLRKIAEWTILRSTKCQLFHWTFCKDFGISGHHIMHALKYK